MTIRTVILDFDGTCTDVEQEAAGFLSAYKREVAALAGIEDIEPLWREKEAQVAADPSRHGMRMNGALVAPPVDVYLLATAVSALILPDLPDQETERLFRDNYRFTTCCFKPESRAVLEALAGAEAHLHVVTNSEPTSVARKLDALALGERPQVHLTGSARKFLVVEPDRHAGHPWFDRVPHTLEVTGWGRPIHPRRGHYFDVLASIWEETQTTPEETLVIGDVFELDLVTPALLGAAVHLVEGPRTLPYEVEATRACGGSHDPDLRAALDALHR